MAFSSPARMARLHAIPSMGGWAAGLFTSAVLVYQTSPISRTRTEFARPNQVYTTLTSPAFFASGPPTGVGTIFPADPRACVILPSAKRTSPLVNMPWRPVPLSFEISSAEREESASLGCAGPMCEMSGISRCEGATYKR